MGALAWGLPAPNESWQWLALVVVAPLILVLKIATPWKGFLAGWLFGALSWASGSWWVQEGMVGLMQLPVWQAGAAGVAIWLYQGLPFAVLGLVCGWMNRRGRPAGPVFCASLFTLLAFLRPTFCPVSSAVCVVFWPPFIQVADLGGEYLVLFLVWLFNGLVAEALYRLALGRGRSAALRVAASVVLFASVMGYGHWRLSQFDEAVNRLPPSRTVSVATVQPNVPVGWGSEDAPIEDFASDEELCLRALAADLDRVRKADFVVFPELPRFAPRGREFGDTGLEAVLQELDMPALLPGDEVIYADEAPKVTGSGDGMRSVAVRAIREKYNALFVMPPGGRVGQAAYRKVKLVPFSEATPLRDMFPWMRGLFGRKLEETAGEGVRLLPVRGLRIQPLICFESGFADLVRQGVGQGADMLVEVSNDGWFASRTAEMMHLGMAVFRTVEARRPLIRCSNTGGGAHVLASGEPVPGTLTPHGRSLVTVAEVASPETTTPYARWGNSWLWGLVLVVLWGLVAAAGRFGGC